MKRRHWISYVLIFLAIVLLHNLVYLPGPSFLYTLAMITAFGGAFVAVIALFVLPVAIIWAFVERKNAIHLRYALHAIFFSATMLLSATVGSRMTMPLGRSVAIHRATPIINYVEDFKKKSGYYPSDLSRMTNIPSPLTIGVRDYQYEPVGLSYKIRFVQPMPALNAEVVTYRADDRHKTEGEHSTLHATGYPHWKYYIYD